MIFVLTNSRKYAINKLLALRVPAPMAHISFIESLDDLEKQLFSVPSPAIQFWQRGRQSEKLKRFKDQTESRFATGVFRDPTPKELENKDEHSRLHTELSDRAGEGRSPDGSEEGSP